METLFTPEYKDDFIQRLQHGDLIEFNNHENVFWAIYLGMNEENEPMIATYLKRHHPKARVEIKSFYEMSDTYTTVRINNMRDFQLKVLYRKSFNYHKMAKLLKTLKGPNCNESKHFVEMIRYGKKCSCKVYELFVRNFTSDWFTKDQSKALTLLAQPGDRIEFKYKYYSHWGIYLKMFDDVPVIAHFGAKPNTSFYSSTSTYESPLKTFGNIDVHRLTTVCDDFHMRINNILDKEYGGLIDNYENRIESFHNKYPNFHPLYNNCEHFVNFVRYGVIRCDQISDITAIAS